MESSAAATQPSRQPHSSGELQTIVAASQPVVSALAAQLMQPASPPAANAAEANARQALFVAAQLSMSPAPIPSDPLLEARPADASPVNLDRAEFDAEQTRVAAWRTLIGQMSDVYPNARPQRDVVKIQLAPAPDAKGKPAAFFATHAQSAALTNVTLALEIVHALTGPSPTAVQYYFIPRWPAGQRVFFPAECVPNVPSRELLDQSAPSPLRGLSGVIEVRAQLWSDRIAQPSQPITFDSNFQTVARNQLDEAYRIVDDALRTAVPSTRLAAVGAAAPSPAAVPTTRAGGALIAGPILPARPDLDDNSPALARARVIAQRTESLLPPASSLDGEARALAAQPLTALRDLRKRQVDALVAALAPRTSRAGIWVTHRPGLLARLARPADREAVLGEAGVGGGRLILTIDSRMTDGSAIAAILTEPEQPELHRKFNGRLQVDASTPSRLLLNLRATQPPPARPPALADLKRVVHWTSLLLELRGNALIGIATAGPAEAATTLNVVFANAAPVNPAPPANTRAPAKAPPRPTTSRSK
jgi:hypothetical protein